MADPYVLEQVGIARGLRIDRRGHSWTIKPVSPSVECTTREEVMFFDTDCGQVVHNIAYLRMIETCRTRLAAKLGMDLVTMSETRLFPVVTRTEIDYRKPGKLGDWLIIHGRLGDVGAARFWCEFEIRREKDDALLITCKQALALVQMPEGRPVRLPKDLGNTAGQDPASAH